MEYEALDADEEEAQERRNTILRAWAELGRPGSRKVVQYLRKRGHQITENQVLAVLKQQTAQQVFHAPWKSEGFIVASVKNDVWQADLLDNTSRSSAVNQGYRYAYVIVDVWSRSVAAVPARVKTPQMSVEAMYAAHRQLGGWPKILETDNGGEWKAHFADFCQGRRIHHIFRDVDHKNGLAVVDSAIARLRRSIAKEQVELNEPTWLRPLERAVAGLNRRPMRHLLGESPEELDNPVTGYALDLNAGQQMLAQTRMLDKLADKLRSAGRFRVMIPNRQKPSQNPSFSGEIHQVASIDGSMVRDERGNLFRIWLVRPVVGGESVTFPRGIRSGNEASNEQKRERVHLFAEALKAHIGDGRISLRAASAFLNTLPGYRGTTVPELLDLFPELFRVDGRGQDISISARVE